MDLKYRALNPECYIPPQAAAVALMSGGTRANGDERANETARDLLSSRSLVPRDRLAVWLTR